MQLNVVVENLHGSVKWVNVESREGGEHMLSHWRGFGLWCGWPMIKPDGSLWYADFNNSIYCNNS